MKIPMESSFSSWGEMVQWWEEWQLRVLALSSLFLQIFLFSSAALRRYRVPGILRACIWLAYLGCDALAIYGLATLFNRHRGGRSANERGKSMLEVMWAPVFLVHLAGPDSITAYNIEDNELWTRHALTAASQTAVALYVFRRSWSGEHVLLRAPVCMFAAGILKLIDRVWALRRSSIRNLVVKQSSHAARRRTTSADDYSLASYVRQAREEAAMERPGDDEYNNRRAAAGRNDPPDSDLDLDLLKPEAYKELVELFIDFPAPYTRRLRYLKYFLVLSDYGLYHELRKLLDEVFQAFYTKKSTAYANFGLVLRGPAAALAILAAMDFSASRYKDDPIFQEKDGFASFDETDVKVTYILYNFAIVMEPVMLLWLADLRIVPFEKIVPETQSTVAQFNLIAFATRSRNPTIPMWIGALIGCKDYVNQNWYLEHRPSAASIIGMIREDLKDRWASDIRDAADYRRFNVRRGLWTLRREQCDRELGWSVTEPRFDEAVVIWHVATELCFHREPVFGSSFDALKVKRAREMFSYLMYLLVFQTEMLMAGSQQSLLATTCRDIRDSFRDDDRRRLDEGGLARAVFDLTAPKGRVIRDARRLAQALDQFDARTRWGLITGVSVEMMCYSASRCRGYLHLKSMATGCEFLTVVWLLLSRMGMDGLADKLQRPEVQEQEPAADVYD